MFEGFILALALIVLGLILKGFHSEHGPHKENNNH